MISFGLYMHPYILMKNIAEPILEKSAYQQISEECRPDVFGSAYSVFQRDSKKIRLIWDGKDGWGYAQAYVRPTVNQPGHWQDIDCFLIEDDLENVPKNESKSTTFGLLLKKQLFERARSP